MIQEFGRSRLTLLDVGAGSLDCDIAENDLIPSNIKREDVFLRAV